MRCWAVVLAALATVLTGCDRQEPAATGVQSRLLVSGAAISGANGIHFAPDGRLFVASVIGNELLALDPESGEVLQRWTPADGVDGPDDVAFGPSGEVFWTSILTGEVAGFLPDGKRVTAARLPPGVNPLTFSDDGRLFVAQCFFGDRLYEVDPNGVNEPRVIRDDLGPGCGLNGMDWGPDARLYGPRWFRGEVVSFDVDSGEMRVEAEGFEVPAAVKFDRQGRLHVLDTLAGEIVRVSEGEKQVVARLLPGLDNFDFDAGGRLFVSSFADGFVARVAESGQLVQLTPGGMAHPGGVAMFRYQGSDTVAVADLHALRGFDPETGAERFVQRNVLGVSPLGSVINVAADGDQLILTSWIDNSVRIWDPVDEAVVERFDDLGQPVSAVRFGGGLAVAEHSDGRVILVGVGEPRVLAERLRAPTGLAVDGEDLYVSERATGRVLKIVEEGRVITPSTVAAGLALPEGVAVTRDGLAVVEAATGRIVLVNYAGEAFEVASVTRGSRAASDAQPPSLIFNGVAAADGVLFATSEADRRLYRIEIGVAGSSP